jgi:hypothetical protein
VSESASCSRSERSSEIGVSKPALDCASLPPDLFEVYWELNQLAAARTSLARARRLDRHLGSFLAVSRRLCADPALVRDDNKALDFLLWPGDAFFGAVRSWCRVLLESQSAPKRCCMTFKSTSRSWRSL